MNHRNRIPDVEWLLLLLLKVALRNIYGSCTVYQLLIFSCIVWDQHWLHPVSRVWSLLIIQHSSKDPGILEKWLTLGPGKGVHTMSLSSKAKNTETVWARQRAQGPTKISQWWSLNKVHSKFPWVHTDVNWIYKWQKIDKSFAQKIFKSCGSLSSRR